MAQIKFKVTTTKRGKMLIHGATNSQLKRALTVQYNSLIRTGQTEMAKYAKRDLQFIMRATKNPKNTTLYYRSKKMQVLSNMINAYGGRSVKINKSGLNTFDVVPLKKPKWKKSIPGFGGNATHIPTSDNEIKFNGIIDNLGGLANAIIRYPDVLQAKADYYGIDLESWIYTR